MTAPTTISSNFPIIQVPFGSSSTGDLSADATSDQIAVVYHVRRAVLAIQAVFTGVPDGILDLQCSLDADNWTNDANSSAMIRGSGGQIIWDRGTTGIPFWRVRFRKTQGASSSGTLTVKAHGKIYS